MPALVPPASRLSADPVCQSPADVSDALAELSWLAARGKQIGGELEAAIAEAKAKHCARLVVEVEGENWTIADRAAALNAAIAMYAEKERSALLDGEAKSREFTHGTIGWRKSPAAVDWLPNRNESGLVEFLQRACDVLTKLRNVLAKAFPWPKIPADRFVDLKLTLNKTRLKEARSKGELSDKQLRELGLKYSAGDESFYVKVNDYPTKGEASA